MSSSEHYDVVIIGSGPGGGTMAWRLAKTGKRILLLERGDYLPRERENWDSQAVFIDGRYQASETWYGADGSSFRPGLHNFVGGNSKVYGAVLFRLREPDFGEIRHVDGISPAWPLSYRDFEPYYQLAEELYHVHGLRGEDPTEPPANKPSPIHRSHMNRASSSYSTGSSGKGIFHFIFPSASCSTKQRARCCRIPPAFAAMPSTAILVW